ncbi:hypothetical protein [Alloalcanivorax marinus]|uniref:hypothetical protein n=1 Tax=Alloalcanivorax marinus TaxID=1177169 RepID=UPI001931B571|nr:hypothetical protein [Alloalcanivorax marinus]MBL7252032.1 hypothetical protein [Alloalcanivorax marinus]
MATVVLPQLRHGYSSGDAAAAITLLVETYGDSLWICLVGERQDCIDITEEADFPANRCLWGGLAFHRAALAELLISLNILKGEGEEIVFLDEDMNEERLISRELSGVHHSLSALREAASNKNVRDAYHHIGYLKACPVSVFTETQLLVNFVIKLEACCESLLRGLGQRDAVAHGEALTGAKHGLWDMCNLTRWQRLQRGLKGWVNDSAGLEVSASWREWSWTLQELTDISSTVRVSDLEFASPEQVSKAMRWHAASFFVLAESYQAMSFYNVAYVYHFRALECLVDAALLLSGSLDFRRFRDVHYFVLNGRKVKGFFEKWAVFSQDYNMSSRPDINLMANFGSLRNAMDLTHGGVMAADTTVMSFAAEVHKLLEVVDGAAFRRFSVEPLVRKFRHLFAPDWCVIAFDLYRGAFLTDH